MLEKLIVFLLLLQKIYPFSTLQKLFCSYYPEKKKTRPKIWWEKNVQQLS